MLRFCLRAELHPALPWATWPPSGCDCGAAVRGAAHPGGGPHGKAQSRTRSGAVTAEAPGRTGGRSTGLKRAAAARSARPGRASTRAKLGAAVASSGICRVGRSTSFRPFGPWQSLRTGPRGDSRCSSLWGGSGQLRCHVRGSSVLAMLNAMEQPSAMQHA